jgi:D-amino-acid dehydrogenase
LSSLSLNTGHGTLGWKMACGSGTLVSDLVMGRRPEIRTEDLGVNRYREASAPFEISPHPASRPVALSLPAIITHIPILQ